MLTKEKLVGLAPGPCVGRTRKRNEEIQNLDGFEIPKVDIRNPEVLDKSSIDRLIIVLHLIKQL